MAEATDTYSDLDLTDSDGEGEGGELNEEFTAAANRVKFLVSRLDAEALLKIYALYKQAIEGPCSGPRPSWYEMQGKRKWEAWNALGQLSSETAKREYVQIVTELDPDWKTTKPGRQWAAVSSLQSRDCSEEGEKDAFDFCKEGDVVMLEGWLRTRPDVLETRDADGLGLIHWAADRGRRDALNVLLKTGAALSQRDSTGQTALHYAASCGHVDCVELLVNSGADKSLTDDEGLTAADVAADDLVLKLLL